MKLTETESVAGKWATGFAGSSVPRNWGLRLADRRALLLAGDALIVLAMTMLALWLWTLSSGEACSWTYLWTRPTWLYVLAPCWLMLNIDLHHPRIPTSWSATTYGPLLNSGLFLLVYLTAFFVAPRDLLPSLFVLYFIGGSCLLCVTWRWLYIRLFATEYFQRRALVVGAGSAGRAILDTLRQFQAHEYTVVGFIDDDPSKRESAVGGVRVLGDHSALLAAVRSLKASEVILAVMGELQGATFQTLLECQALGVPVVRMSSLYEQVTGRVPLNHLDEDLMAASFMDQTAARAWSDLLKRAIDVLAGSAGMVLLAALFPLIAAAIWTESHGPVFYRQIRLGRGGRQFMLVKFRTMIPEAEADGRPRWAEPDDKRVTRVGRFLRRFRLDEVPQFWNVLLGHMSLVGPRPERPEFIVELECEIPFYRARHLVKPGITGWAQVNCGYGASVADAATKLQWDLYYIKHRSTWLDLITVLRTIGVVLAGKGS